MHAGAKSQPVGQHGNDYKGPVRSDSINKPGNGEEDDANQVNIFSTDTVN
ncbi:hypothetical protein ES703_117388 [subsurface metagenome]